MVYYFSGVGDAATFDILREAGVRHILVDPYDLKHIPEDWDGELALDSGAYKEFKEGRSMSLEEYVQVIRSRKFSMIFNKDVIGDGEQSFLNWKALLGMGVGQYCDLIPVWGWGDTGGDRLDAYLIERVVGVGGLAKAMRDKDEDMLKGLSQKVSEFPGRFHLFGLNWVKAINSLHPIAFSADSSKWLDAGRYGSVAFIHSTTGKLGLAPARCLPEFEHLAASATEPLAERKRKRRERSLVTARTMNEFLNHGCLELQWLRQA